MKALFVCAKNVDGSEHTHHIHQDWMDSVEHDKIYVYKNKVPGLLSRSFVANLPLKSIEYNDNKQKSYDIIVLESPVAIYYLPKIARNYPDTKIAYINATFRLYPDLSYSFFKDKNLALATLFTVERKIDQMLLLRNLREYVDYAISAARLCDEELKKYHDIETGIVFPHISNEKRESLSRVNPDLSSKNAVFIGVNRPHKNVDGMVRAWKKVREEEEEATLYLIGEGHDKYKDTEGVKVTGYLEWSEVCNILSKCSLYLHVANFENSGTAIVEAMSAGLPSLISTTTGAESIIEDIDREMIIQKDETEIAESVLNYFNKDINEKEWLSNKSRVKVINFTKKKKQRQFRKHIERFVG